MHTDQSFVGTAALRPRALSPGRAKGRYSVRVYVFAGAVVGLVAGMHVDKGEWSVRLGFAVGGGLLPYD